MSLRTTPTTPQMPHIRRCTSSRSSLSLVGRSAVDACGVRLCYSVLILSLVSTAAATAVQRVRGALIILGHSLWSFACRRPILHVAFFTATSTDVCKILKIRCGGTSTPLCVVRRLAFWVECYVVVLIRKVDFPATFNRRLSVLQRLAFPRVAY